MWRDVIQAAALYPHVSVRATPYDGRKRSGAAAQAFALNAVVALLGISALMDRRTATFSGAERQRVAIARALATARRLVRMDEPVAALDAERKPEVLRCMERLRRRLALPIDYGTHAVDEVASAGRPSGAAWGRQRARRRPAGTARRCRRGHHRPVGAA